MKKILTLVLALALSVSVLSGCGSKPASDKTPEELAGLYSSAITENGGEMAEYNPAFTQAKEDDGSAMALRTKAVISSPSRSTLRSMSASIRFHRNCRKKPT